MQRYYDPTAGRFLSVDPLTTSAKDGSSFNLYAYANNSPYKHKDSDGRIAETIWDVASLALSVQQFSASPSVGNAVGVAVDAAAVIVPGIPGGVGALRAAAHAAEAGKAAGAAADFAKGAAGGERAGKSFTPAGKAQVKTENAAKNNGQTTCAGAVDRLQCPRKRVSPASHLQGTKRMWTMSFQSLKVVMVHPRTNKVLCRDCNLSKSSKMESQ
jgi:uncharacterized protein RhaS with RHS repeats